MNAHATAKSYTDKDPTLTPVLSGPGSHSRCWHCYLGTSGPTGGQDGHPHLAITHILRYQDCWGGPQTLLQVWLQLTFLSLLPNKRPFQTHSKTDCHSYGSLPPWESIPVCTTEVMWSTTPFFPVSAVSPSTKLSFSVTIALILHLAK